MAIIICCECQRQVSDKSDLCIHCGNPFPVASEPCFVVKAKAPGVYYANCPQCGKQNIIKGDSASPVVSNDSYSLYRTDTPKACKCGLAPVYLKEKIEQHDAVAPSLPTPSITCPRCGSHYTQRISGFGKGVSFVAFGVFSANTLLHDFKCRQCGHKFNP